MLRIRGLLKHPLTAIALFHQSWEIESAITVWWWGNWAEHTANCQKC
ncbi:hypothetical protein [Calothrix sp. NIES-2100]